MRQQLIASCRSDIANITLLVLFFLMNTRSNLFVCFPIILSLFLCLHVWEDFNDDTTRNTTTLPTILLAGAKKGGTAALAHWLKAKNLLNQGVCGPKTNEKEVHFFDKTDSYRRGWKFYAKQFRHCLNKKKVLKNNQGILLSMDATPAYMLYPERVFDIYQKANQLDSLKIIFSLREPISRDISWYNHCRVQKLPVCNDIFQYSTYDSYAREIVISSLNNSTRTTDPQKGMYANYLAKWFELFRRNQILILSHGEILENPIMARWRVETFLGQYFPLDEDSSNWKWQNSNNYAEKVNQPLCSTQNALQALFQIQNNQLYKLLRSINNRPPMEQHPFPEFKVGDCIDD